MQKFSALAQIRMLTPRPDLPQLHGDTQGPRQYPCHWLCKPIEAVLGFEGRTTGQEEDV
jgi:hypothetical protein